MEIISVSVGKDLLEEIDQLQKKMNFSGRSDFFRTATKRMVIEFKEIKGLEGKIDAVLIVSHNEKGESEINELKHRFEDVIKTQIHNHVNGEACLEIFVLNGESNRIKQFYNRLVAKRKTIYSKLFVA